MGAQRSKSFSALALIVASACWGSVGAFVKLALDSWPPLTLLIVQLTAANVVLWATLLLRGYRRPRHLARVLLLGVLEPGLCYALITLGLLSTTASNAAVLSALESFFVVVLAAIFLHERIGWRSATGLAAALAGVLVLEGVTGIGGVHLGDALVLAGIFCAACWQWLGAVLVVASILVFPKEEPPPQV